MFSLFVPRYLKNAKAVLKHARRLLHYKKDRLSSAAIEELRGGMESLRTAIDSRDERTINESATRLDALFSKYVPPVKDPGLRENCEVFLVAIVIAIGVRTYYLQPFTIPTGSMQPTLNGIIGHPTATPPPNVVKRIVDRVILGRSHVDIVAETDDTVLNLIESKRFVFFTSTTIMCERSVYRVGAPRAVVERDFGVALGKFFPKGSSIVRGYIDTGDHVFVDKVSYNFRPPQRGDVFVFNTQQIAMITRPGMPSQFYIKRLTGTPGDELRIAPPDLFINGDEAKEPTIRRVMSRENGYRGYANGPSMGYLSGPAETKRLKAGEYFAMGDNSYNSLDSRYYGPVPQRNIMGRGFFVYWPFGKHWGFIR